MFGRRARERERAAAADPADDDAAAAPRERGRLASRRRPVGRGRAAGAAAVGAVGAGILGVARLVMLVATLITLLILLAIVLRDLDANAQNSIVKAIHDAANFFASPFNNIFKETGHPKRAITINWGIAAVVFFIVGSLLASLIRRIGARGALASRRAAAA
jgi:hypothetical protein